MENRKCPTLADIEAGNVEAGELAEYTGQMKRMADAAQSAMDAVRPLKDEAKLLFDRLFDLGLPEIEEYIATNPPSSGAIAFLIFQSISRYKTAHGRKASDALHSKKGGSREKAEAIRNLWSSGNYSSRDICAEQEFAGLKWNYASARKALRNTPDPAPWPAKGK
ncbi:hypothetical protein [Quatrionicoccus australiensis]|uniref:hypothetical protein n=1 Tax=Quatrionicoccus australiensis TaxID=138118 RepID=UPI001CF8887E|nr:hypothetical protein [Quatrionicoccus australiensis]UCV15516.1 hypothetical protein KI612_02065 [Quatrionicoccus australiensis]